MYGKFFASTFTGSMFGAGPDVFAVWGYVIAHAVHGVVELNPRLLASILGTDVKRVNDAIAVLCQPDADSRNPEEEGRRLIQEGPFQYRVTSHRIYHDLRNEDDRRDYNRQKQQESRARKRSVKQNTPTSPTKEAVNPDVIDMLPMSALSAHTEAEAEAEANTRKITRAPRVVAPTRLQEGFTRFWSAYPNHKAKKAALKAWTKLKPDAPLVDRILAAIAHQRRWPEWTDQHGRFIPHPATWLNRGSWDDQRLQMDSPPDSVPWRCPHVTPCSNPSSCRNAVILKRPENPS